MEAAATEKAIYALANSICWISKVKGLTDVSPDGQWSKPRRHFDQKQVTSALQRLGCHNMEEFHRTTIQLEDQVAQQLCDVSVSVIEIGTDGHDREEESGYILQYEAVVRNYLNIDKKEENQWLGEISHGEANSQIRVPCDKLGSRVWKIILNLPDVLALRCPRGRGQRHCVGTYIRTNDVYNNLPVYKRLVLSLGQPNAKMDNNIPRIMFVSKNGWWKVSDMLQDESAMLINRQMRSSVPVFPPVDGYEFNYLDGGTNVWKLDLQIRVEPVIEKLRLPSGKTLARGPKEEWNNNEGLCCRMPYSVEISSSGAAGSRHLRSMGVYGRTFHLYNNIPVFQHNDRDNTRYFFMSRSGAWKVHYQLQEERSILIHNPLGSSLASRKQPWEAALPPGSSLASRKQPWEAALPPGSSLASCKKPWEAALPPGSSLASWKQPWEAALPPGSSLASCKKPWEAALPPGSSLASWLPPNTGYQYAKYEAADGCGRWVTDHSILVKINTN